MDCSGYSTNRSQQQDDGSMSWASSSSTTSFEGAAAFEQSAELQAASTSQTAEQQTAEQGAAPQPAAGVEARLLALEARLYRSEAANMLDGLGMQMMAKGFAWMAYASLLGQGYAAAWQRFEQTMNTQAEADALPGQIACIVLDVVTAGVLGRVVGGLGRAGKLSEGTVDTLGPTLGKILGLTLAVSPAKAPAAPTDPLTKALGFAEAINGNTAHQVDQLNAWRAALTASDVQIGAEHVTQLRAAIEAFRAVCPLLQAPPDEKTQVLADRFERGLWAEWLPTLLETQVSAQHKPLPRRKKGERGLQYEVAARFNAPGEVVADKLRALGAPLRTPWDATAHTLLLTWAKAQKQML